ncbi:MAG: PaaX family transcriptional regulator C-terminal domain-containing protein, partial [Streptosporangiaceae bacterium]
ANMVHIILRTDVKTHNMKGEIGEPGGEVTPRMGLVAFAFGAASAPHGGELPGGALAGRALIRLLAELGLSPGAARSLLLRMRREGWLDSEREGREARYRLAPAVFAAQARIERQLRGQRPPWEGSFNGVLYEIPEQARPFRDRLRRTAQLLGYATLRPGLLIATTDRWAELGTLLPAQPPGSQLLKVAIALEPDDSRAVAARLWNLEHLAAGYRRVLADLRTRTAQAGQLAPGGEAFRAFAAATLPVYEVTADDPDLPAELLPADWPGDELTSALGQTLRAFFPLIRDYLIAVTS